jgi:hypothetical protein
LKEKYPEFHVLTLTGFGDDPQGDPWLNESRLFTIEVPHVALPKRPNTHTDLPYRKSSILLFASSRAPWMKGETNLFC